MRLRSHSQSGGRGRDGGLAPPGYVYCVVLVGLVFVEQIAFGANGSSLALAFAFLQACMLGALFLSSGSRHAIGRSRTLRGPGLLFAGVIVEQLTSLTALGSKPNAPIWQPLSIAPSISINHEALVIEVAKLMGLGCVFLIALTIGRDRQLAWRSLGLIVMFGFVYALISLTLHVYSPSEYLGYTIWTGPERLAATLGSANVAGAMFGLLLLTATAVLLQHRRDVAKATGVGAKQFDLFVRRAPLDMVALVLFAICLLMTGSRGAVGATAAMLILLLIWEGLGAGSGRTGWLTPLLLVLALFGTLTIAGDLVANRYQDSARAANDRLALFATHWRAFQQSPYLGSGLGSFRDLNGALMTKANYGSLASMGAAHNVLVQWLEQTGWIGSALIWCCIGWILIQILLAAGANVPLAVLPRLAIASSGVLITHGLTDFALETPSIAAFWTLLLGLAYGRLRP